MTTNPAPEFVPRPNRDAYAAIRGYLYQVDVTIQRWFSLQPNEELELECGEDIDIIHQAFSGKGTPNQSRILEQVKHSERLLTLRSPVALEAIESYFAHLTSNPQILLKFRFVTNSSVGRENGSTFPDGIPGIEAWQRLSRRDLSSDSKGQILCAIRELLKEASGNNKFKAFLENESDAHVLAFLLSFEWSVGNPTSEPLQRSIEEWLLTNRFATSRAEAERLYEGLFCFTARTLTAKGRKKLTSKQLQIQLSQKNGDSESREHLQLVQTLLSNLNTQISTIEHTSLQNHALLEDLNAKVDSLVGEKSPQAHQVASVGVSVEVPPPVDPVVKRESAV